MPARRAAGLVILAVAAVLAATGIALAANDRAHAPAASPALPGVVRAVQAARRGAPIPAALAPPLATIKMFPRRFRIPPACIAQETSPRPTTRVCRVGRASSRNLIVLLGDSHAFMWLPAVLSMAARDNLAVVPLIRFGCTPGRWFPRSPTVCADWFRWGIAQTRRLHPAVTLLGGSIGEEPSAERAAATAGMIAGARIVRPLGPLVVIGDPEGLAFEPVPCLTAPHATMASCTTTWDRAALGAYDTVARATRSMGVGFLRTRGFVCYARRCPAVVGHTIVWMDNSHITGLYSAQLAGPFRAAFLRARP